MAIAEIASIYFEALRTNEVSAIPYHEDVELWAPLGPDGLNRPIVGIDSVRAFLEGITPSIDDVSVLNLFENGDWQAGRAIITMANPSGAILRVFDVFHVKDGKVVQQENHYDPRAVLS
jgi:hypothetical protein